MTPFFIIFFLLTLFSYVDLLNIKTEQRLVLLPISPIILALFAGLRYGDLDYLPYQIIFEESQYCESETCHDCGYTILNGILGDIWNDPLIVFMTIAAFLVLLNIKYFCDYGKYALLALLFYFVHNYALKEMKQIRAGLVCAIGLHNVRNMERVRCPKFWILQILSMTLHFGVLMFAIGWFAKLFNFSRKHWIIIIIVSFIIGTVYPFGSVFKSLPGMDMLERVQTYSNWGEYAESLSIITKLATLKQLFFCSVLFYFCNTLDNNIKYFKILSLICFYLTYWLMVWNDFAILGTRMGTFLSVSKSVLVMRDTTERPEAVNAGTEILIGTNKNKIVAEALSLLNNEDRYLEMSHIENPYGDGQACQRIAAKLNEL